MSCTTTRCILTGLASLPPLGMEKWLLGCFENAELVQKINRIANYKRVALVVAVVFFLWWVKYLEGGEFEVGVLKASAEELASENDPGREDQAEASKTSVLEKMFGDWRMIITSIALLAIVIMTVMNLLNIRRGC